MAIGYGIGKGLESFGDSLMRIVMHREDLKQKAMDRALTEKRLDTQEGQQEAQAQYYRDLASNQREQRDQGHAEFTAKYYGGADDVPQEAVDSIAPKYRATMVKSAPTGGTVSAPIPEGAPSFMSSFEKPEVKHSFRQPQTAGERTAGINAQARAQTEQLRQSYLMKKLASDEKFKQMAHELGEERLMAFVNQASQQIGMQAANMDQRAQLAFFEAQMDAKLAEFRAANDNQVDPKDQMIMELLKQSVPGFNPNPGGTPGQPATPQPIQIPALPPRGGVRPSAAPPSDPSDPLGVRRRPPQ